jgi:glycine/D-amino acid oxidase-like deaminating enzyme
VNNGRVSFWLSRPDAPIPPPTNQLAGDTEVDVAIVGGGLSGLWTAWALLQADPSLSVAVLESKSLGYGASGRFGGWLSAKEVGNRSVYARGRGGRDAVLANDELLRRSMVDVVDVLGADAIDAQHGGWMKIARSPSEQLRIEAYLEKSRQWGVGEERLRMLTAAEAHERVHMTRLTGALYSPDMFSVDPAKMVFQLARLVLDAGGKVFTRSHVDAIRPGAVVVGEHQVSARQIVVATEGYTSAQPGQKRQVLPLNSALLVTEPLTPDQWKLVGWDGVSGISGSAHTYFYGNRTRDGRIVFGGRGIPYRFGSGVDRNGEVSPRTVDALMAGLADVFPQVHLRAEHAWCGVIGVSRDWSPYIDVDGDDGIIRMGAYFGTGITATHLAGRIVADLILKRRTELSESPWVRPAPRRWEPEPLRWIGATGLFGVYTLADRLESRSTSPRTSRLALLADRIAGR